MARPGPLYSTKAITRARLPFPLDL